MKSIQLLKEKRFGPFFWTQFWGAFNDNLYKNALVILIAYRAATEAESGPQINIALGLFILPFFLFSPIAGQIADKFEKSKVIRFIKLVEIFIMISGAIGFWWGNREFSIAILFLMGTQSAFFGPIKYSIMPQVLATEELVPGNAMVELGTFLAILLGTITGGIMIGKIPDWAGLVIVIFAVIGYWTARRIPEAPSVAPDLKISWNFFREIRELWLISRQERSVHLTILGISWFWFYGAVFLSQIPNFTKFFVGGNESVGTLFLGVFSISIGVGSLICEKLSGDDIELGLVPFGSFGLSLFALDLYLNHYQPGGHLVGALEFLERDWRSYRVLLDLICVGMFGAFYIVPLYALMQKRSAPRNRSRLIAWLNIVNSLWIIASAGFALLLYKLGFNTPDIFAVTSVINFLVLIYIFFLIPEFLFRFLLWILAITIYRMRFEGRDNVPLQGPVLIVCNHVSFIDWLIATAACRRPPRFVMDYQYFNIPGIRWFFKLVRAIPIAQAKENAAVKAHAFERIREELLDGQVVCVYPEGGITRTGDLAVFRTGVEHILKISPVPVVPMAMQGLWGSFFSRYKGRAMQGLPTPTRRKITVKIGRPMPPTTSAAELEKAVRELLV